MQAEKKHNADCAAGCLRYQPYFFFVSALLLLPCARTSICSSSFCLA